MSDNCALVGIQVWHSRFGLDPAKELIVGKNPREARPKTDVHSFGGRFSVTICELLQRDRLPAFFTFAQRAFIRAESSRLVDADIVRRRLRPLDVRFVETKPRR
jgi:hypothetical protein